MGSVTRGLAASFFLFTTLATGFIMLVYQVQWPIGLLAGTVAGLVVVLLLRNREKNLEKWRKRPTTFPNPLGGGIVGEYMKRPWMQELAEIGRAYGRRRPRKGWKARPSKEKEE